MAERRKKAFKMPHICHHHFHHPVATLMTWIIPAGQYASGKRSRIKVIDPRSSHSSSGRP